jgi:D-3-phosphoglycerate dehydrogenase
MYISADLFMVLIVRIVVTDPIFLPSQYRERLEKLGDVKIYESEPSSTEELISRLDDAEAAVVSRCAMPAEVFERAPRLKFVTLWRTGYDDVDVNAATAHGIVVANAPGYSNEAVAEHVFALLLSFLRRVPEADFLTREGKFECSALRGRELKGKTMGVMGTGRIGARVIEICKCYGMDVVAYDMKPSGVLSKKFGYTYVGADELYRESDFISLHIPLTEETRGMIGMGAFRQMKRTAVLVNTARGGLVDEQALVAALKEHVIAGACLDVFEQEPLPGDSPLLTLSNVVLTPHTAFNTQEAVENCTRITIENIESFARGQPSNVINAGALDIKR